MRFSVDGRVNALALVAEVLPIFLLAEAAIAAVIVARSNVVVIIAEAVTLPIGGRAAGLQALAFLRINMIYF